MNDDLLKDVQVFVGDDDRPPVGQRSGQFESRAQMRSSCSRSHNSQ
jgi:hypothetical protein